MRDLKTILAADIAEIGSLSSKNKNAKYLKPLKEKKGKTVLNDFIEIVNESMN